MKWSVVEGWLEIAVSTPVIPSQTLHRWCVYGEGQASGVIAILPDIASGKRNLSDSRHKHITAH